MNNWESLIQQHGSKTVKGKKVKRWAANCRRHQEEDMEQ